ncbi:MAG: adenosine deaminase [Anaerolineaceae bacterium]|nr:adenosine deaminase [Anaerolineaceae bacterium]
MQLENFINKMPKVELHVHLEGAIQPETLLKLSKKNHISLPADDLEGIRKWYNFTDFARFVEIYMALSKCLISPEDIELITREFLIGQAQQNILYSEVTYTAYTHFINHQIAFEDQIAAINRARDWASKSLGVEMGLVIDISRDRTAEESELVADWAISAHGNGVVALGLGGPEIGNPPEKFAGIFERVFHAGLPAVPHAGETEGPDSIWGALKLLHAVRIGHGVRCLEDPDLVKYLREKQIPLDVCPTSNICLKVAPSIAQHPLPALMDAGLYITINSDDPPMFSTNLTNEFQTIAKTFSFDQNQIKTFVYNALEVTLQSTLKREALRERISQGFQQIEGLD